MRTRGKGRRKGRGGVVGAEQTVGGGEGGSGEDRRGKRLKRVKLGRWKWNRRWRKKRKIRGGKRGRRKKINQRR